MNPQVVIAPGELRSAIQIQAQTANVDALGGQTSASWTTVRSTMAGIATFGQKDRYQAEQFTAQVTHTITVRWTPAPSILPGMQVLYIEQNGTIHLYTVQAVDNVLMRNVKLNLLCLEINGGQ